MKHRHFGTLGAALFGAFILAACSEADEGLTGPDGTIQAPDAPAFAVDGTAELGEFEVCKTYVGAVGPAVTVDYTVDYDADGSIEITSSVQLADGECAIVHTYDESNSSNGTQIQRVNVTEQVPSGYTAEYQLTTLDGVNTSTGPVTSGNSVTADMSSNQPDNGFLVDFINTEVFVPGNEGCTPGYWKQPQHFDSYPAGFAPTTPFIGATTGFSYDPELNGPESGYASDLNLLQALSLRGGGGINDLIRHAAAAILNTSSSGVAYPYSVGDVQDAYNIDHDKYVLAEANEAGCPLN